MKCGAFYCDSKRVSKGEKSNEGQEICIVHAIIGFRGYRQAISLLVVVVIPAPPLGFCVLLLLLSTVGIVALVSKSSH